MKLIISFTLIFIMCISNLAAANLLSGDASVETECRNMTYGTWGATVPGNPSRLEYEWDNQIAFEGNKSIKISKPAEVSAMEVNGLIAGQDYTFSFWAKSEHGGTVAYISVAPFLRSTWRTRVQKRKEIILSSKWQHYSYTFKANGKHDYVPIYGVTKSNGASWFDAFQLEAGKKATEWQSPSKISVGIQLPVVEGNVYMQNAKIPVKIFSKLNKTVKLVNPELKLICKNYLGKKKILLKKKIVFNQYGLSKQVFLLPSDELGWFALSAEISQNDKKIDSDYQALAVVAPPLKIADNIQPFSGISMSSAFPKAFLKIGAKWLESVIHWHYAERRRGIYDFEYLVNYSHIRKYKKMGFLNKVTFSAWGVPDWLQTNDIKAKAKKYNYPASRFGIPEYALKDWEKLLRNFLDKNSDTVDMIEIGGELDVINGLNTYYKSIYPNDIKDGFIIGKPADDVAKTIEVAAKEIRRKLPNVQIAAVRPSDVDTRKGFPYSKEIFKRCGKNLTAFGLDCYPRPRWIGPGQSATGKPFDLKNINEQAKQIAKQYCAGSNIYISEYGYFIDYKARNEVQYQLEQANRLARSFLVAKAVGMKQLFWYSGQYPSNQLEANRFSMSIWTHGMPFSAVPAYSAVARVVENVTEFKLIQPQQSMAGAVYRKDNGNAVAALWSIDKEYSATAVLTDAMNLKITDMMGNALGVQAKKGKIVIQITEQPVYIWRTQPGTDNYTKLAKIIDDMSIVEKIPADLFFRLASDKRLKIYIKNRSLKKDHAGYVQYVVADKSVRSDKFQLPADETVIVNIPLPVKYCAGEKIDFIFNFAGSYKPYKYCFTLPSVFKVERIKPNFTINGSMEKWKNYNSITINSKDHIMPRDFPTWDGPEDLSVKLYAVYDNKFLYLAAAVKDDLHFNKFSGKNLWKGDCFQMAFDLKTNYTTDSSLNIYNIVLAYACNKQTGFQYAGSNKKLLTQSQYSVTRNKDNKSTFYEIKIPLKALGIKSGSGNIFGFNALFLDDDSGSGQDYWIFLKQGFTGHIRPDKFIMFMFNNSKKRNES